MDTHLATSTLHGATLRWLNDLTSQGILTTDTELRVQSWNRWLEQHSGHSASSVVGRPLLEIYPELVSRQLDRSYAQALQGQIVVLAQRLHRYLLPMPSTSEGSTFHQMQQSAQIAPLAANGQIIGTITVIEDVTEREDRERELQRRIAALEGLHHISRAILSLDLPECLQQIIETTASITQVPLVAVVLRLEERLRLEACSCGMDVIDDARLNMANSIVAAVVRSGQFMHITDVSADKAFLPLGADSRAVMAAPLIVDSSVIGALAIESPAANVLTHDDQMQVRILAAQAAIGIHNARLYRNAQEAIRVRDTFLSIASHELKTPLTSILGQAQLLQRRIAREGGLNERGRRSLDAIANQASRLNRMMSSLLDLSRIQSGQLSIQRAPLDLRSLIRWAVQEMELMLDQHEIQLSLPEEAMIVDGDELRLEQVLYNLLQNAVKYSPLSKVIRVEVTKRELMVCVRITDEGIGIRADELPRLFDRFYRAGNSKSQHISGFGVGLYVVREIVSLHGGLIEVASEEGRGSSFTVCLPLYSQHLSADGGGR